MDIWKSISSGDEAARWLGEDADVAGQRQPSAAAPCSPLPAALDSSLTHPPRTGGGEKRSHLPDPPQELPQLDANVVVPLPQLLTPPWAVSTSLLSTPMVLVLMAQQNPLTALLRQQSRGRAATTSPFLVWIAGIRGIFTESAR